MGETATDAALRGAGPGGCAAPHTAAKKAVVRILAKLGLHDRVQIAVLWHKAGMD